jgi:hypothetical protein
LGVKALDQIFEAFRSSKATPSRVPLDQTFDDVDDDIDPYDAAAAEAKVIQRPPILEITSSSSAAGKTTLLYYLTAKALLSAKHGGKASMVVWLDTDGRFSATRLHHLIDQLSRKTSSSYSAADALEAVQHVYIFRPTTSSQLLDQLTNLPTQLLDHGSGSKRPLGLLVLDSATAFQYQDRFDAELSRLEAGAEYATRPKSPTRTSRIIAAFKTVQSRFECTIVFSTHQHMYPSAVQSNNQPRPSAGRTQPATQQSMIPPPENASPISPWAAFATLSLTVSRLPVSRFAPAMTLEECLRDRDKRAEAVGQGKFSIGVDWSGSERWPLGVKERVMGLEGKGRVEMVVKAGSDGTGSGEDVVVEVW